MRFRHPVVFCFVLLAIVPLTVVLLAACSSSTGGGAEDAPFPTEVTDSGPVGSDAADSGVGDASTDAATPDRSDTTVCDDVDVRIAGCGLHHSFPDFTEDCPVLVADGMGAGLKECSTKVCVEFRLCLTELLP